MRRISAVAMFFSILFLQSGTSQAPNLSNSMGGQFNSSVTATVVPGFTTIIDLSADQRKSIPLADLSFTGSVPIKIKVGASSKLFSGRFIVKTGQLVFTIPQNSNFGTGDVKVFTNGGSLISAIDSIKVSQQSLENFKSTILTSEKAIKTDAQASLEMKKFINKAIESAKKNPTQGPNTITAMGQGISAEDSFRFRSTSRKLHGDPKSNMICGSYATVIDGISPELFVALNSAEDVLTSYTLFSVNPTGLLIPSESIFKNSILPSSENTKAIFNNAQMNSIFLNTTKSKSFLESLSDADLSAIKIYILDTSNSGLDIYTTTGEARFGVSPGQSATAPATQEVEYTSQGHGSIIKMIVQTVAAIPDDSVKQMGVCGIFDGKLGCDPLDIIKNICEIQARADFERKNNINNFHIINLSMGSTERNPTITKALKDATRVGVSVVMSHGNDDLCIKAGIEKPSCMQYPADDLNDDEWDGAYSVAASTVNYPDYSLPPTLSTSNRSYYSKSSNVGKPTIYAPGTFFFVEKLTQSKNYSLYSGSSFATPVFSAAVGVWRACQFKKTSNLKKQPSKKTKDITDQSGDSSVLNLEYFWRVCQ